MSGCPLSDLWMKCESFSLLILPYLLCLLTDPYLLLLLLEALQVEPDAGVVLPVSPVLLLLLPLLHLHGTHGLHPIVIPD